MGAKDYTGLEIAVTGMACRFPGAGNVSEFWGNLMDNKETITFFTDDELLDYGISSETIEEKNYVKACGSIHGKGYFDYKFFDYLPKEAEIMEPQLRILHEICWHALEDAGCCSHNYNGSIGVYLGAAQNFEWQAAALLNNNMDQADRLNANLLTNSNWISQHLSHKLNLKGPGYTINTACSSSLVAVHIACRALLTGECDIAVAGGVKLHSRDKSGYFYQEGSMLSPDGHNRTFDKDANGTVFTEGAGVIVLKRLQDSIRDKDNVYAVLKGSAINNDGANRANYSSPNLSGQASVIKAALKTARIPAESLSFIEAHGTATPLGDPIEIEALKRAFNTEKKNYCGIGSVKTNIGHADAASGIAGLMKTILSVKHKKLPGSLHYNGPNSQIDFKNSPFYVNTHLKDLANDTFPLRAGVSSFGIGGANAHVIVEEFLEENVASGDKSLQLLTFSAKSKTALKKIMTNFSTFLTENRDCDFASTVYSLNTGKGNFPYRKSLIANSPEVVIQEISQSGASAPIQSCPFQGADIIFLFSGIGSQYVNMGIGLYKNIPYFKNTLEHCFHIIETYANINLKEIIFPALGTNGQQETKYSTDNFEIAQLAVFSFGYSLAKLLIYWGISPDKMIGYSFGEYVAACVSGIFSLGDAIGIILKRGKLIKETSQGAMLSVPLPADKIDELFAGKIEVAIDNGDSCVISGEEAIVKQIEGQLRDKRVLCYWIRTDKALHSSLMEGIKANYIRALQHVEMKKPQVPFVSNLSGTWVRDDEATAPDYWGNQLRYRVNFRKGIDTLMQGKKAIFIEIGFGNQLTGMISRNFDGQNDFIGLNTLPNENRAGDEHEFFLGKIARLWSLGINLNWGSFYKDRRYQRVNIPLYPFDKYKFQVNPTIFNPNLWNILNQDKVPTDNTLPQDTWLDETVPDEQEITKSGNKPELSKTEYLSPTNDNEEYLVLLYQQKLGYTGIGILDDFFELGGDSLKAASLISIVNEHFNVHISLNEFFLNPTVKKLSLLIGSSGEVRYIPLVPVEKMEFYKLSSSQKRVFVLNQLDPESIAYNLSSFYELKGELCYERFEHALQTLINRHDILQTAFKVVDDEPVQYINKQVQPEVKYFSTEKGNDVNALIKQFITSFILSDPPLIRIALIKTGEQKHILILDMHHIISDGLSNIIMANELIRMYSGKPFSCESFQYRDIVKLQLSREWIKRLEGQKQFWVKLFENKVPVLNLPYDFPRANIRSSNGDVVKFRLDNRLKHKLEGYCKGRYTIFMYLMAVYDILLSKLSGQEEIVVGVPVAGRRHKDAESVVGMFVNTLAMLNFPRGAYKFSEFLHHVKTSALNMFDNQDFQYEELVDVLSVSRDTSRNPLFDVMFVMQNTGTFTEKIEGIEIELFDYQNLSSKFDLTLSVTEKADALEIYFQYNTDLFIEDTIKRYAGYFISIIEKTLSDPDVVLESLDILSNEEKDLLLYKFNDTTSKKYPEGNIIDVFKSMVLKNQDKIAVVCQGKSISYRDLDRKSDSLAQVIIGQQLALKNIAICCEPSVELVTGILAIIKSGAAFIPLEPEFNQQRNKIILNESCSGLLITQRKFKNELNFNGVVLDIDNPDYYQIEGEITDVKNDDLYVIYTSGSTGTPKGVMITHKNILNYVRWYTQEVKVTKEARFLINSSFAFDAIYTQFFGALLNGGELHLLKKEEYSDIPALIHYIDNNNITHLKFTPTLFNAITNSGKIEKVQWGSVDFIMIGGEQINTKDLEKFVRHKGHIKLMNHYGPTETTIGSIATFIPLVHIENYIQSPAIGKPIYNTKVYILNENLGLTPIGVPGEICIGGDGVGKGYLNNLPLTQEKFIVDPFSQSGILYKTGDLGYWDNDGNVRISGRIDNQIKIRGYRIEPEEIEREMNSVSCIKDSVVVVRETKEGEKNLCAFYISEDEIPNLKIKKLLAEKLPGYMIPSLYRRMDKFPLTGSGKIDLKSLPDIVPAGETIIGPQNKTEKKLTVMWSEILNIDEKKISIHADFFELGGHSLKAFSLLSRINTVFQKKISLLDLFNHATIFEIAKLIATSKEQYNSRLRKAEKKEYYKLSSSQRRLFIYQQLNKESILYNNTQIITITRDINIEKLKQALSVLMYRHEAFRTGFEFINGEPVQVIHNNIGFDLPKVKTDKAERYKTIKEFIRPFDLGKPPLCRFALLCYSEQEMELIFDIHHIITDNLSNQIVFNDLLKIYADEDLTKLNFDYKDYSEWQNAFDNGVALSRQEAFWLNEFKDGAPTLDFPYDFFKDKNTGNDGGRIIFEINEEVFRQIDQLNKDTGCSLFMFLLAAYYILLGKYNGKNEIVVGTPVAGRGNDELDGIVGFFINMLALKCNMERCNTFYDLLIHVKAVCVNAYANQDYQYDELVNKIQPGENRGMFDVVFSLGLERIYETNVNEEFLNRPLSSRFDLVLIANEYKDKLIFNLMYKKDLFRKETMKKLCGHYLEVLGQVLDNKYIKPDEITISTEIITTHVDVDDMVDFNF